MLGCFHSEESKKKMRESRKKYIEENGHPNKGKHLWKDKPHPRLGKHCTKDTKNKISESKKGYIPWNKGKKMWEKKSHPSLGKSRSWETKEKIGKKSKELWIKNPTSNGMSGKHHTNEAKMKIGKSNKGRTHIQTESTLKKILASVQNSPNKSEKLLDDILQDIFSHEYKFVGDGNCIIGGKCPDFLNINGKKKLIELFGKHWHKEFEINKRINFFKKFGFDTLIIWEEELKNLPELEQKILNFNNHEEEVTTQNV